MLAEKRYVLVAVMVVGSLLLSTCASGESQAVEVSPSPEEVTVEVPIEEELEEVTAETLLEGEPEDAGAQCAYNAYRMGWVMDYSDAGNMLNVVFHPDSPFQYTSWDDQGFRDLVSKAMLEKDFDTRMALWQEAENILLTDYAAVVPIFHYDRTALVRPEITAVYPPFGSPPFKHWRLPEGQTTMRVGIGKGPSTLDVNMASDTSSHLILDQIMDALYEYDGEGRIQPAGAVSYDVSTDGLVYTIKLRESATWSDGKPVVAQHYVDGIIRLLRPETAAGYAWLMHVVQGAKAFNAGETDDVSTVGVRAVDDYTLEITLEQAASHFDTVLAFSTTYPVRQDVIKQHGKLWTELRNFVGNGAYVLTEWAPGDHIIVGKNPDYWNAGDVTIEVIEFPIMGDEFLMLAAYEQGELDVSRYPAEELSRILENMPDDFRRLPRPGTYYIGLNLVYPPTDNLNVRKALASAVDKRAILENVLEMPWQIDACGVVPPEIPGYQGCGNVGYEFDVEAAQGYLQAALSEMGIAAPADIAVNLLSNHGNDAQIRSVAAQWEANLGIEVNVSTMKWDAYLEVLEACRN